MVQKFLKSILLLMISWIVTGITFFGCNPVGLAWYSAGNILPVFGVTMLPVMAIGILHYQGIMAFCKYSLILISTYICINLYKKYTKQPSPFVLAGISVVVMMIMEGADIAMSNAGVMKITSFELITYIPIIMLNWSTTVIFAYGINRFMVTRGTSKKNEIGMDDNPNAIKILKTAQAFKKISANMHSMNNDNYFNSQDTLLEQQVNDCICNGCHNNEIQYLERARLNYLWFNKMVETREAMAIQFGEVSKIVESFLNSDVSSDVADEKQKDKIIRKLKEKKILIRKLRLISNEKGYIEMECYARKKRKSRTSIAEMVDIVSKVLEKRMRVIDCDYHRIPLEYGKFEFMEEVNFHTLYGSAKTTKSSEQISGDNFIYKIMEKGQVFFCICDGMGSGKIANEYSCVVTDLLEQLLDSGLKEETILRLINSILLTKDKENIPSTLDMALIDLYSGTCRFLKSGAACTFIKRGNWVECIKSTSLPIGVLNEVDVDTITKKMYDGDFVIMMSDGMIEAIPYENKEQIMAKTIMELNANNPKEMAARLLDSVKQMTGGITRDDMTVLVTGMWEKNI